LINRKHFDTQRRSLHVGWSAGFFSHVSASFDRYSDITVEISQPRFQAPFQFAAHMIATKIMHFVQF
jgi:hypothetical protein